MIRNALLLISTYILSGCAAPLNKEITSSHIAQDAGIDVVTIQDTILGSFTVSSKTIRKGIWKRCVYAVTDTELYIYVSNQDDDNLELDLRIPYSEMRGIGLYTLKKANTIQIIGDVGIVALQIIKPDSIFIDPEVTRNLYEDIRARGVPEFVAEKPILFPL